jgi:FtsP/CotA-like multicopper oxidase with cupredoxin domain
VPVPANPRALTLQVGERPGVRYAVPDSKEGWPGLGYRLIPPGIDESTVPFTAPGPLLVLSRGEAVAITVENHLATATSVHWHGIELESYYDGVPGWGNQGARVTPAIQPGESFIARFTPPRAGTFIYHTHLNDFEQLSTGLYGPLIVVEPGRPFEPAIDKVFVLSYGGPDEVRDPLLMNGSATPVAQDWRQGVTYRLRFIGITPAPDVEVSLLRGDKTVEWRAIAKDGAAFVTRRALTSALQLVSPGETYDFEFTPAEAGVLTLRTFYFADKKTTMTIRVK